MAEYIPLPTAEQLTSISNTNGPTDDELMRTLPQGIRSDLLAAAQEGHKQVTITVLGELSAQQKKAIRNTTNLQVFDAGPNKYRFTWP